MNTWDEAVDYTIEKKKLYEMVADKLEQSILAERSKLGTKLPSEQTLADNFGVSRNVVREALKLLNARGLIELRTGEGAFAVKPRTETMAALLNRIVALESINESQILEMRILLESRAASMAAQVITAEGIRMLEQETVMMRSTADEVSRIEMDLDFHLKIAEFSGNPLLAFFIGTMIDMLKPLMRISSQWPGARDESIRGHLMLIDMLKKRDSARAEQYMTIHLSRFAEHLMAAQGNAEESARLAPTTDYIDA